MQFETVSNRERIDLNPQAVLGTGGEARVYALRQNARVVAKIYHRPTAQHAAKLQVMVANPPQDPMRAQGHISIAWPVDLLKTAGGEIAGFLMPCVKGMDDIAAFYNPKTRLKKSPQFNYKYLHRTARNVATAIGAIHACGYVVGDINESNILVADTSLVTFVDTDSFQVCDPRKSAVYRCPVGKPEYTPPELQGIDFSTVDRRIEHDLFGLGVLLFQVLMEGIHPFFGVYTGQGDPPPLAQRIAAGHFPYKPTRKTPYHPALTSLDIDVLHPGLAQLFFRCFADGARKPRKRPDAETWASALKEAEEALIPCAANDQHLYGKHLKTCPWCERKAQLNGRDPFPSRHSPPLPPLPPPVRKPAPPAAPTPTPLPPKIKKPIPGIKWVVVAALSLLALGLYRDPILRFGDRVGNRLHAAISGLHFRDRVKNRLHAMISKFQVPKFSPPVEGQKPATMPQIDSMQIVRDRYLQLGAAGLPDGKLEQLYSAYIKDFGAYDNARIYVKAVRELWEKKQFDEIKTLFYRFQKEPSFETLNALSDATAAYLHNHEKHRDIIAKTRTYISWFHNPGIHPMRMYVTQTNKLYIKVTCNGNAYASTKSPGPHVSINGAYAVISFPEYRHTDRIRILGYQDDRWTDTRLKESALVNSLRGNDPIAIKDQRGNIAIQIVFTDFPAIPDFSG